MVIDLKEKGTLPRVEGACHSIYTYTVYHLRRGRVVHVTTVSK